MQRSRSFDDNTKVQGVPRMSSWQGPWVLFVLRHNSKTLSQCAQKAGFTGELLVREFLDGPPGMLTEDRIGVLCNLFQIGQELRVSAVAHGDDDVPAEPRIFGALDRRPTKDAAVGVFIHLRQPAQFGVVEPLLRLKLGQGSGRSAPCFVVPRANILADIAAKDVVAHRRTKLFRNGAALFDRQVGNAEARVELARSNDRLRRAGIDAASAAAAAIGSVRVRRKLQRSKNHSQKEPRSYLLIDNAGVLA